MTKGLTSEEVSYIFVTEMPPSSFSGVVLTRKKVKNAGKMPALRWTLRLFGYRGEGVGLGAGATKQG